MEVRKVRDYCLSTGHPRGRHKARVFQSRLGLSRKDAQFLRQALMEAAGEHGGDLRPGRSDSYGQRFVLDFEMTTSAGTAIVRSGWIIRAGEQVIRFVTCYVLR